MKHADAKSTLAALAVATVLLAGTGSALANDHNYNGVAPSAGAPAGHYVALQQVVTNRHLNDHNYVGHDTQALVLPSESGQSQSAYCINVNDHNYPGVSQIRLPSGHVSQPAGRGTKAQC